DSDPGSHPSGMQLVQVRMSYLLSGNTYYWNPGVNAFSSSTLNANTAWQNAGGAGAVGNNGNIGWDYNSALVGNITWPTDGLSHTITLDVRGEDNATTSNGTPPGNFSNLTTYTFVIDNTPPVAGISWPLANGAVSSNTVTVISTATDDLAGVQTLQIEISTGTGSGQSYFTGSGWQSPQIWITTTPPVTNPWYYTIPNTALFTQNLYYLRIQATDFANNTFTSQVTTFTYDNTAPSVSISTPATNTFYSGVILSTPFAGTATDPVNNPVGISTVTLVLLDQTNSTVVLSSPAAGTPASWTFTPLSAFTQHHKYQLTATALDNAGNTAPAVATFVYDIQPATSAVT